MAVSIKDIARIAGVSHSTVSRALRGSHLIPAITASRIQEIADKLGYTASAIGRGLVRGRTETIGVVVTSIDDPFNGEVVAGMEEVANQHGYSVILATSQTLPSREISVVKSFHERRVDGIVVASSRVGSNYAAMMTDLQIPVVLLNNQHPDEFSYSIRIDDAQGTCDATNHLLQLGHRAIGYLGDKLGLHSDTARRSGFLSAMRAAGMSVPDSWLLLGNGKMEGAADAFRELCSGPAAKPSAWVCYNDMSAIGVMRAAAALHFAIPQQLSLVGFDDIQIASLVSPPLTTIRQPRKELGARSMTMLLKLLRGEEVDKLVIVPGELIVRTSTRRLAG